jgi:hypothetical protein
MDNLLALPIIFFVFGSIMRIVLAYIFENKTVDKYYVYKIFTIVYTVSTLFAYTLYLLIFYRIL